MTRKEIYETELPHRAVAVYLYLETRADRGEDMLSGNRYHCQRAAPVCKVRSSVQSMIWSVQDLYKKAEMA